MFIEKCCLRAYCMQMEQHSSYYQYAYRQYYKDKQFDNVKIFYKIAELILKPIIYN